MPIHEAAVVIKKASTVAVSVPVFVVSAGDE